LKGSRKEGRARQNKDKATFNHYKGKHFDPGDKREGRGTPLPEGGKKKKGGKMLLIQHFQRA